MDLHHDDMIHFHGDDITLDQASLLEALPFSTQQFLHDLRRSTGVMSLCKKTGVYYECKIERIAGDDVKKVFTIHYKNYKKSQQKNVSFCEASTLFLPHTHHTEKFAKEYNENMRSKIEEISIQEREFVVEEEDNNDEDDAPLKGLPEMHPECLKSLEMLMLIDNDGKLKPRYPPRYCIEQILKEFDASTNKMNIFNEVGLDEFCSEFENSFTLSNHQCISPYEKKMCEFRGIREEMAVASEILGPLKLDLPYRYIFGVVQLIRYMSAVYKYCVEIEGERALNGKEQEMMLLVTYLAHFINQNKEQYFCEGKDYDEETEEKMMIEDFDDMFVENNNNEV